MTSDPFWSSRFPSPLSDGGDSEATAPGSPVGGFESACYAELVRDGGRPVYPIGLLDAVSKDPEPYKETLRPWLDDPDQDPPDWSVVFRNQVYHWREFGRWRTYNRRKPSATDQRLLTYESFSWHFRRKSPNSTYTDALRTLLAQYDFTRPFQLQDDSANQDALTTWIEYLGFVCAAHHRFTRVIQHHQPAHDEGWKALMDSGVLRPFETREYLEDSNSAARHELEEDQANKAVQLAKLAVNAALKTAPDDPRDSQQAHALALAAAQSRLDAALTRQESAKRRNDLVTKFLISVSPHSIAQIGARRQSILMQWVLKQLPLVEAEMEEAKGAGVSSNTPSARPSSGMVNGAQSRQPRNQSEDRQVSSSAETSLPSPARTTSTSKRPHLNDTEDDERRPKRARKDPDSVITETATPSTQPATSRATRSPQPASATPQTTSSAPRPKRTPRAPVVPYNLDVSPRRSRRLTDKQHEVDVLKSERHGATPVKESVSKRPPQASKVSHKPRPEAPQAQGAVKSKQIRTGREKR